MGPVFGNSYMSRSDTSVLVITPRFCEFLWTPTTVCIFNTSIHSC